jgi:hypothetical protein
MSKEGCSFIEINDNVNRSLRKAAILKAPILILQEGHGIVRKVGGHGDP